MTIALFGGSFDPVHLGHLRMLQYTLENFDFSSIEIIPAKLSPFKEKNLFSDQDRVQFLELIFAGIDERINISSIEIDREGPSYTALTLRAYKEKYPDEDFAMLLGLDNIETLGEWHEFEYLKENMSFVVFARPQYSTDRLGELGIKYTLVENFAMPNSSSEIKEIILSKKANEIKSNRLFDGLVPEALEGLLLKEYCTE